MEIADHRTLLEHTVTIVAAYVSNNTVQREHLSALIAETFATLAGTISPAVVEEKLTPAVPIKRSVQPDFIVCLESGKKLKILKRHLMTPYNMTPDEYRAKWGLPADYPMVAPNYALARSTLAKELGLGRRQEAVETAPSMTKSARKGGGRSRITKAAA